MNDKKSPWFKVFALCTAIGLGGTYVWRQQQKAAPQMEQTAERTVLSGSKSAVIAPANLQADQEVTDRALMPGSKSAGIELNQEPPKQRTVLPGSKSFAIDPGVLPVDETKTNLPAIQQEPEVKERVLLPSSKSIPMPIFRKRRAVPADQPKPAEP